MMNSMRLMRGFLILTLLAAVPAGAAPFQNDTTTPIPRQSAAGQMTPQELLALELQSQADPDNLDLRKKLLIYYLKQERNADAMTQVLWVIQHHPDSPLAGVIADMRNLNTPTNYQALKAAWERAIADNAENTSVLLQAAKFFEGTDKERAAQLLEKLNVVVPGAYAGAASVVYAKVLTNDFYPGRFGKPEDPAVTARMKAHLMESWDPALLAQVGSILIRFSKNYQNDEEAQLGIQLMERAIAVDPGNPHWRELLERVKAEPPEPGGSPPQSSQLSVGAAAAEANLIKKVEPVYPELAMHARVQGTVEFKITIGPDGHVQNISLMRGHPLLVNAAREAVQQWIYRPTLLNGNPIAVTTTVEVPFQIGQQ